MLHVRDVISNHRLATFTISLAVCNQWRPSWGGEEGDRLPNKKYRGREYGAGTTVWTLANNDNTL